MSIYMSVSIFPPYDKVLCARVCCAEMKSLSYLLDVKNGDIPPPLMTLYLHSNNLWHELLPRVWLITREPPFLRG